MHAATNPPADTGGNRFLAGGWPSTLARVLILAALAAGLVVAWREFWFLTDDAFITFRYIDHHRRGWGYTWNPPPFAPVEGYSNFLWMVLLQAIWAVTGTPPPAAANPVSLILSLGSVTLAFVMAWRMPLPARWQPLRFALAVLVLLHVLTNRTFLTWTSSGLETALFGFCVALWVLGTLEIGRGGDRRWLLVASTGATTSALTRPDGLLLVAATLLLAVHHAGLVAVVDAPEGSRGRDGLASRRGPLAGLLLALVPLLAIPAHLLWRRWYYGMWVPNTYYAKQVTDWPDAGVRYTQSFILENGLWAWLALAAAVAVFRLVQIERGGLPPGRLLQRLPAALITATFTAHVCYYAFVVGGDHFEYRVFAYLIIPIALSLARLVVCLPNRPAVGVALFVAITAVALPLPWIHYVRSRALHTRDATFKLFVPVADAFPPGPLRSYARTFDQLQKWMSARHVGSRQQEHKMFAREQLAGLPSRQDGEKISWKDRPVIALSTVGVPGWVLPEVAIIDNFGLNDKVIARNPVTNFPAVRLMAHERTPPAGYVDCFHLNFGYDGPKIRPLDRRQPALTDEVIRDCETRFAR